MAYCDDLNILTYQDRMEEDSSIIWELLQLNFSLLGIQSTPSNFGTYIENRRAEFLEGGVCVHTTI